MLEMNMTIAFPAAPLLTVILALVGKFKSWKVFTQCGSAPDAGFNLNPEHPAETSSTCFPIWAADQSCTSQSYICPIRLWLALIHQVGQNLIQLYQAQDSERWKMNPFKPSLIGPGPRLLSQMHKASPGCRVLSHESRRSYLDYSPEPRSPCAWAGRYGLLLIYPDIFRPFHDTRYISRYFPLALN